MDGEVFVPERCGLSWMGSKGGGSAASALDPETWLCL